MNKVRPAYPPDVLVPAGPELTNDDRLALARAVAQFNRGSFFECHETLEAVWLRRRGSSRDFFQALIQVSVGFHHLERGNRMGARKTFTRALARFEPYPARYSGFDVAGERARLRDLLKTLQDEERAGIERPPIWVLDDLRP